ncbi:MAG: 23S rRNA (uracil(1939)-C(5))-methyltransferase RlmD [Bacteroidota bacterium]
MEIKKDDIIEVTIESTGFEGKSVARIDGMVVFVDGAIAGDVVKAKVYKSKKKYAEAKLVELVTPSPQRTAARCKYFGVCGGCKWQHVEYATQLGYKQQHVADALERIGGFKGLQIEPIIGSDDIFYYRNKLEFSFSDKPWWTEKDIADLQVREGIENNFAVGFHVPQRWDKVLNIDECFLQSELSTGILNEVRAFALKNTIPAFSPDSETGYFRNLVIREGKNTGDVMVNVVSFEDSPEVMERLSAELQKQFPEITTIINNITKKKSQVAVGEYEKHYYGDGIIHDKLGKHLFQISANSFFQTNTKQAERLYSIAKDFAAFKPTDVVYDLYCGTGSIGIYISDFVQQVIGIELVESSIQNARKNAELNGITNCEFIAGDLKDLLTKDVEWRKRYAQPDVIIVDPPRNGMHPKAVEELGRMKVPTIVYVSCNPATLARDLQMLAKDGYKIEKVQPVDMFPHTYHIECVVKLVLA